MKAKQYTTVMLIALIFASASIQAQSARRPATPEKKERARTEKTYKKETSASKAQNTQPARQVQANQVRSQQSNMLAVRGNQARRPVSMTTSKNPRSAYRKTNRVTYGNAHYTAPVKSRVHHKQAYYGGHHYHYAYPSSNVKIHYHHNTYVNRYHVLYYPTYGEIYWSRRMYRDYLRWYPGYRWTYNYGYRIQTLSVWDAKFNLGEVAMVYGRVYASWYNNETDDYLLFFGGDFPRQQFTAVVPGHIARKFSWRPERYFLGEHVTITGLITSFDGSPEIVIKNRSQLSLY